MDKQMMAAFCYVANEVVRIMTTAMKDGMLPRKDWDKVNALLKVFRDEIKELDEWKEDGDQ